MNRRAPRSRADRPGSRILHLLSSRISCRAPGPNDDSTSLSVTCKAESSCSTLLLERRGKDTTRIRHSCHELRYYRNKSYHNQEGYGAFFPNCKHMNKMSSTLIIASEFNSISMASERDDSQSGFVESFPNLTAT